MNKADLLKMKVEREQTMEKLKNSFQQIAGQVILLNELIENVEKEEIKT